MCSYRHLWKRNHYYKPRRWFWGRYRRIARHLYRLRTLRRWDGSRWHNVRSYWHFVRRNYYNHKLHGKTRWRWGRYRHIGVHLCRLRVRYRNYQGRWRKVRSYWHLWKRNHYYKPFRWFWGRWRRIGYHLYRLRVLKRWTGTRWVRVRAYWYLWKRNHYRHRLHGRQRWIWGRYRRVGHHQYRLRTLKRNYNGHWRKVRSYWHLWRRNHYYKLNRWF